mmetsp:Transcript_6292/g.10512  ORF Transcript_6292/g.10512 Transcript_6292/m.10512 type:complete len:112 (+) Transcript_6292:231-566(+)
MHMPLVAMLVVIPCTFNFTFTTTVLILHGRSYSSTGTFGSSIIEVAMLSGGASVENQCDQGVLEKPAQHFRYSGFELAQFVDDLFHQRLRGHGRSGASNSSTRSTDNGSSG